LHCAQVPPPPQAEGTNSWLGQGLQQLAAGGLTVIVFSPLIVDVTLPLAPARAARQMMTLTSASTIAVNSRTPKDDGEPWPLPLQLTPPKDMKASDISPR
jgi:hypothetical protein